MESNPSLVILHWNDAYQIESQEKEEPLGGAARFVYQCNQIKNECNEKQIPTMVTCAGDIFNPSMLSVVHKGKQMLPLVKALGIC